eukprot:Clim_evm21s4 gene=Clim_evmTU21s4
MDSFGLTVKECLSSSRSSLRRPESPSFFIPDDIDLNGPEVVEEVDHDEEANHTEHNEHRRTWHSAGQRIRRDSAVHDTLRRTMPANQILEMIEESSFPRPGIRRSSTTPGSLSSFASSVSNSTAGPSTEISRSTSEHNPEYHEPQSQDTQHLGVTRESSTIVRSHSNELLHKTALAQRSFYEHHKRMSFVETCLHHRKYREQTQAKLSIEEALELLGKSNKATNCFKPLVSDNVLADSFLLLHTARTLFPDDPELHFLAMICNMGRLLLLWGEPDWVIVGETYPVGCRFQEQIAFYDFLRGNPDFANVEYGTYYGVYQPNCGFDAVVMCWSDCEYLYSCLSASATCNLSDTALAALRLQDFHSWIVHGAYHHLAAEPDFAVVGVVDKLHQIKATASEASVESVDETELLKYATCLIDEFCPGKVDW